MFELVIKVRDFSYFDENNFFFTGPGKIDTTFGCDDFPKLDDHCQGIGFIFAYVYFIIILN